jgi:hypothetical protein
LPYKKLTDEQVTKLMDVKAKMIYMDFDNSEISHFGFNHIGGIIAAGVAYLNDKDLLLMNLYRLLTDDDDHGFITVDQIKNNPKVLMFILKPVTILEIEAIKRLNGRMESLLIAA